MYRIQVDHTLCTGCRSCQTACSIKHRPGLVCPTLGRIHVFTHNRQNTPVISGVETRAACLLKTKVRLQNVEYDSCMVCRASCPEKAAIFRNDETVFSCDLCGQPDEYMPVCVQTCSQGALTVSDFPWASAAEAGEMI